MLFGRVACKSSGCICDSGAISWGGVPYSSDFASLRGRNKQILPYPTVRPGIFREHSNNDSRARGAVTRGRSNGGKWSTVAGGEQPEQPDANLLDQTLLFSKRWLEISKAESGRLSGGKSEPMDPTKIMQGNTRRLIHYHVGKKLMLLRDCCCLLSAHLL